MNKLVIVNHKLEEKQLSESVIVSWKEQESELQIKICKSTSLDIEIHSEIETILKLQVEVEPHVNCQMNIINQGRKSELTANYIVKNDSKLTIIKLMDINTICNYETLDLKESGASAEYILKTACSNKEKYDLKVFHHAKNTTSNLINHGINLEKGTLEFNVSSYIPEGVKGCIANQNNRIINLTNQECIIKPNLFIEEYDVIANHSAHVGSFKEDEIFYLERLGIPYETACKLLLQGFMKSFVQEDMVTKVFEKYWR